MSGPPMVIMPLVLTTKEAELADYLDYIQIKARKNNISKPRLKRKDNPISSLKVGP